MRASSAHPRAPRGDDGIAVVAAIGVVMLVSMLIITTVSVAVYEARATGRDRARSSAVASAEAWVDTLTATIQSTAPASLPCGPLTSSSVIGGDNLARNATVTYYNDAGAVVPCSALPTTRAAQAAISVTASTGPIAGTQPAERTIETLVRLKPSYANDLDKAIFGNAGVTLANHADIYGQNGQPDADVYTNGNVTCNNNQHYHGSIYAQGTVSMANSCVVEVDVHARNGITATNPSVAIKGRALVSNGNISLGPASLGQQARASGSVSGNICSTPNKCFGSQSVPAPAAATFPQMKWADHTQWLTNPEWSATGVDIVTFSGTSDPVYRCGMYGLPGALNGKVDYVGKWLYERGPTLSRPTIVLANCPGQPVKLQGVDISLNDDVVLYTKGGVNFSNKTPITSTNSEERRLYLIHAYDSVPASSVGSCGDGIALDNQVTVHNLVDVLMYSPCSIRKANNTAHYGQIYAGGTAQIDNKLEMYFRPLPVFGVSGASTSVEYYNVETLYKRENH